MLGAVGAQTVNETQELSFTATATGGTAPLTYSLDSGAPAGAVIDISTGAFNWTPTEAQGPDTPSITVRVTDNAGQTDFENITVTVNEVNQAPVLDEITNKLVEEGHELTFTATATDDDLPANDLTFSLDAGAPTGAAIDANSGVFTWTPTAQQGPATYSITVRITDDGSPTLNHSRTFQVQVTESAAFLAEGSNFVQETLIDVDLGQQQGTRTIRLGVDPSFDTSDTTPAVEDLFAVYLVDPNNTSTTLLDRGTPGTALFTLEGANADFVPGLVRYDGQTVEIDVTSLSALTTGQLKLQLINSDSDDGTEIRITTIENEVDTEGTSGPQFPLNSTIVSPGGIQNVPAFSQNTDIEVAVRNVRLNSASGQYTAELQLQNNGDAIGQQTAVVFEGLPAGVTLTGASGNDASGNPYINFAPAITAGGLTGGAQSNIVEVSFDDPGLDRFSLTPKVLSGGPNQAPTLDAVAPLSVNPGGYLEVQLNANDADGDNVTFRIRSDDALPTGMLHGDGRLTFSPVVADIGSYSFDVIATDGAEEAVRNVTLDVVADPVTTTRISGFILNTDEQPIPGIPINIGSLQATTAADGSFTIESAGALPADTLIVHGEAFSGSETYPFIAEKLNLLFGRDPIDNVDNVISRPIYLPALDTAQAQTVNPSQNTTVSVQLAAGEAPAEVFVAAGTLEDQQGQPFTGDLSITEVPRDLTPAALPDGVFPDTVVTIQPGELNFTTPAPLTLPNRAGLPAGTEMQLWSINPTTGDFDNVGSGAVSTDGSVIETLTGGIRNSSWHFWVRAGSSTDGSDKNEDQSCSCSKQQDSAKSNSRVELHSGSLIEEHSLVTHQSLGATRGLMLRYDSERADARPILHFGFSDVVSSPNLRMTANLTVSAGSFDFEVPGGDATSLGLSANEHFWTIPAGGGRIEGALQTDLRNQPTGIYDYTLRSGLLPVAQIANGATIVTGTRNNTTGRFFHVNEVDSPFGAGWSIPGLQRIYEAEDGAVMQVDGNGFALLFLPPQTAGQPYQGPSGDFSVFEKLGNGTFRQTMKNQTVYQYDAQGRIASMTDRNGNQTQYLYNGSGDIEKIVDPAGLETNFNYTGSRVTSISHPGNRTTSLQYDATGNLTRITDPDNSARNFRYDDGHRMIGETNKRGFDEATEYNFAGRAIASTAKDGSRMLFDPAQIQSLLPPTATANIGNPPEAFAVAPVQATFTDSNGDVTRNTLDAAGQRVDSTDQFGTSSAIQRNSNNLVTQSVNGRGQVTTFEYDANGNVIAIRDELSVIDIPLPTAFPGPIFDSADGLSGVAALHDVNADGRPDLILPEGQFVAVRLADGNGGYVAAGKFVHTFGPSTVRQFAFGDINNDSHVDIFVLGLESVVLPGNGDGTFGAKQFVALPIGTDSADLSDINGDGNLDLLISSFNVSQGSSARTTLYLGAGDGTFSFHQEYNAPSTIGDARFADLNSDGHADIVSLQRRQNIQGINPAVRVRLGDGAGNFTAVQTYGVRNSPVSVSVGDLNGDTIPDIATANDTDQSLSILFGVGDGTFVAQPRINVSGTPVHVSITDLTADGIPDLIATFQGGGVTVIASIGDGTFGPAIDTAVGDTTVEPAVGDTNADGKADLVLANSSQSSVLLLGLGTGGFVGQLDHNIGQTARAVTVADLDGDRIPEIITSNDNSTVSVLPGGGDGTFLANVDIAVASDSRGIATGDFNEDGFNDIVATNRTADTISIIASNGDGTYAAHVQHAVGDNPQPVAVADVDDDGHLDVLTVNLTDNSITTLLGNGDGTFQAALTHNLTNQTPRGIAVGDLNGDQVADLVLTSGGNGTTTNGKVSILIGNGDGTYTHTPADDKATVNTPRNVELVDFDNDGKLDVATINADQIMVFPGIGDGTLGNRIDIIPDRFVSTIATGDVNADGNPDILVGTGFNSVLIYEGDGSFGFDFAMGYATASVAHVVATGDFDGNRQLDFVAGSFDNTSLDSHFVSPRLQGYTTLGVQQVARTFTYDSIFNQVLSETDELGRQTLFTIDPANGNVLTSTRVVGDVGGADDLLTTFTYTAAGQVDTITDPLNRITDFDYDALGRLITTTVAQGTADQGITRFEYDAAGNLTASIDENNNRTEFGYDDLNRLTLTRDALTNVTTFTYDAVGNLITTTDARNNATTNTYDELNRLISTVDELNLTTSFTYDNLGNLLSTIDPLGNTTTNRYDSRDRLQATVDPDGGVTAFRYDADDNLRVVTDPVNNVTTFVHDARDRVIREIDPLGNSTFFTYDVTDNLIEKLDRNDRITEFTYDDLDRLTSELWVNADGTIANEIVNTYDKAGNLLTAVDNFSALTFTYDNRDRVLTTDNAGTPQAPNVVLTYTYDAVGNVLSVADTIEGSAGGTTTYAYDDLNRVEEIRQFGNNVSDKRVDFTYNELGQYNTIVRYSDLAGTQPVVTTTYTYDNLNRLIDLRHNNGTTDVAFYEYDYDEASRISQIIDVDGTTEYTYDRRSQLTAADHTDPNNPDESYEYDANGNRVNSHLHGNGYVAGAGNRLLSESEYAYEYDAEGNVVIRLDQVTQTSRHSRYDHHNRLVQVVDTSSDGTVIGVVEFGYDAFGRRITSRKAGSPDLLVNAPKAFFVYDEEDVSLEFIDPDGTMPMSAAVVRRNLHGPAADQILGIEAENSVSWLLPDTVGSVRDIVGSAGQILNHIVFDSFGNILSQTSGIHTTRYLYTGREFEEHLGIYHFRSRNYDPAIGIFLEEDTIRFRGGDANLRRYVFNLPTQLNDPDGTIFPAALVVPTITVVVTVTFLNATLFFPFADGNLPINEPFLNDPPFDTGDVCIHPWFQPEEESLNRREQPPRQTGLPQQREPDTVSDDDGGIKSSGHQRKRRKRKGNTQNPKKGVQFFPKNNVGFGANPSNPFTRQNRAKPRRK